MTIYIKQMHKNIFFLKNKLSIKIFININMLIFSSNKLLLKTFLTQIKITNNNTVIIITTTINIFH